MAFLNKTILEGVVLRRAADRAWVKTSSAEVTCLLRRGVSRISGGVAVGDRVQMAETGKDAYRIEKMLPRKNYIPRPHLANITQAVIVTAFQEPTMNLVLVDRLLVIGRVLGFRSVIVFNKKDLQDPSETSIPHRYHELGYRVIQAAAKSGEGIRDLENQLMDNLSVFLGASGVGKTSLLRALDPQVVRPVGELSLQKRQGRHTTSRSEIFFLRGDSRLAVADTPGFDWLNLLPNSRSAIRQGFPEIERVKKDCAFKDCVHGSEPRCAVRRAVGAGTIWSSRYDSYRKFVQELQSRKKVWKKTA